MHFFYTMLKNLYDTFKSNSSLLRLIPFVSSYYGDYQINSNYNSMTTKIPTDSLVIPSNSVKKDDAYVYDNVDENDYKTIERPIYNTSLSDVITEMKELWKKNMETNLDREGIAQWLFKPLCYLKTILDEIGILIKYVVLYPYVLAYNIGYINN